MQTFSGIFDRIIVANLKILLGKNLYVIYSPGVKIMDNTIQSESFSIPVFGDDWQNIIKWMNFKSRNIESQDEQSFNHLNISTTDKPNQIDIKEEAGKKRLVFPYSSFIVKMESGWEIEKIEIYRKEENFISFEHSFDYAVIFCLPNNREICICADEITGNLLTLTEDKPAIEEVKKRGFIYTEVK